LQNESDLKNDKLTINRCHSAITVVTTDLVEMGDYFFKNRYDVSAWLKAVPTFYLVPTTDQESQVSYNITDELTQSPFKFALISVMT